METGLFVGVLSWTLERAATACAYRTERKRAFLIRILLVAVCLIIASFGSSRAIAQGISLPKVTSPEAIVMDGWTGQVLYGKHPDVMRAPASTVKIMTAFVVLKHHIPLARVMTVSPFAASYGGSSAGLYAGEPLSVWNLLHGMLLPSGNDAAIALSQTVSPSIGAFAALMNREARRLRLTRTHYITPNGFDVYGQVTTARDLANLTRAAMQLTAFAQVVRARQWVAHSADGRGLHDWYNLNKLLWSSPLVDGVKTGTTPAAGACLVTSAHRGGRWIIEVNLGSTEAARFSDGAQLLNYGFAVDESQPSTA